MSDLYQLMEITGKGLGCIAAKDIEQGTVILRETPLLKIPFSEGILKYEYLFGRGFKSSFDKLNNTDQNEYLMLHNKFDNIQALPSEMKLELQNDLANFKTRISEEEQNQDEAEKMLKIISIWETNAFQSGVYIKLSRFNHSCRPNSSSLSMTNGKE